MKIFYCVLIFLSMDITRFSQAQHKISQIVEGGKTLVELITVLKKKPAATNHTNGSLRVDSCNIKQTADACFKNSSAKDMIVSLCRRQENSYELAPFTMRILSARQECWYELRSGIYRYRIETDSAGIKTLISEGEMKLQPCDNMRKEVFL